MYFAYVYIMHMHTWTHRWIRTWRASLKKACLEAWARRAPGSNRCVYTCMHVQHVGMFVHGLHVCFGEGVSIFYIYIYIYHV